MTRPIQKPRRPLLRATTLVALLFALALLATTSTIFAFEQDRRSPGLHDDAGVFTEQERVEIEEAIQQVEAAGAPTVVYLRLLYTESDQAVGDAQRLMEAWEIESTPGAHDGVVIFFNLEPNDPDRGEFGIVAGEEHYDGGALPQSELNRIRDAMIELLADDRMAEAIVLGLEATAERIIAGPPESTAIERLVDRIGSGPFSLLNVFGIIAAAVFGVRGWRAWGERPRVEHSYIDRTTDRPGELHPALAGALVQSRVDSMQVEATVLELAKHRAIAFEPDPDDTEKVQIRLLDRSNGANPFEFRLLDVFAAEASNNILDQSALGRTRSHWGDVETLMREDLRSIGWFDPDASRKRTHFYVLGALSLVVGLLYFIPLMIIEEAWLLVGGGSLAIVGAVVLGAGASYPSTTPEGERQAIAWRGYRDGLQRAAKQNYGTINLDDAFPYIVAFGLPNQYKKHFEQASERGYVPAWVDPHYHHHPMANNWFIYWVSFHNSVNPEPSGSGGSAGGAASGSGGAGGRF